jgi:hypothetical protein
MSEQPALASVTKPCPQCGGSLGSTNSPAFIAELEKSFFEKINQVALSIRR